MQRRIDHWKAVFESEERAISKELSSLAWDVAAFTCIVEMVQHAPMDDDGAKKLNFLVFDMLATGFWAGTMQAVRRLAEQETIWGGRGVCSLGGLIADARLARNRLTRRVFVEVIAGVDYNYRATEGRYWRFLLQQPGPTWVPMEFRSDLSAARHAQFDWLSGTTPATSSPDDLIRVEVFDRLDARLSRLQSVIDHVNVEIAHAATGASREGRALESWRLDDAKDALRELTQIAQLVGDWFCNSGVGTVLPHPQFDQFAYVELPLFAGNKSDLQARWDALKAEMGTWHQVSGDDLFDAGAG